jgi:3-oxoacyl-[acyl-carrier protein] reductase
MTISAPLALVTGASRGIGAATARLLARRGWDVAINYRSKGARANDVAAHITALGQQAFLVQADMTLAQDRQHLAQSLRSAHRHLQLLVLNASGGMEKDKPETYAMELNHTAQVATVRVP